ncbi:hypothetical protein FKM82_017680 [Ascaphus truei]
MVTPSPANTFSKHVQNLSALCCQYRTAFLLLICLLLLAVTIGLSVRLSLVSQHRDSTTALLEHLREEHGALNDSLSNNIHMNEAAYGVIEEMLRKTRAELEQTRNSLNKSQEQLETTYQELENTKEQKNVLEFASQGYQEDLRKERDTLRDKDGQLGR